MGTSCSGLNRPSLTGVAITDKSSGNGMALPRGLAWGFSCMQGWRDEMEDAHIAHPSLGTLAGRVQGPAWDDVAIFGVFDGHGGSHVSSFCQQWLPQLIAAGPAHDPAKALTSAFFGLDEMLRDPAYSRELAELSGKWELGKPGLTAVHTGSTACVCCVRPDVLICANAGDSRAVLSRGGEAIDLSEDHKPGLWQERERITKAGGWIDEEEQRVCGDLALSRAIGDLIFKQNKALPAADQIVSAKPDVRIIPRAPEDEFILIACDGLWDATSSQGAVNFIRTRLGPIHSVVQTIQDTGLSLSTILEDLLDAHISSSWRGNDGLSDDNMTAVLAVFCKGKPMVGSFAINPSQAGSFSHM
mmetsp:Transcript_68968/g.165505  ORF Transcript_68968/g.165505 Transcript_68968/m.165505 type:complete len:358 (-) Transcript_68968:155-1228(-)